MSYQETLTTPEPLDFLKNERIADANQKIIESEQNRWRLLTWVERIKLQREVARLAKELKHWNALTREYALLKRQYSKSPTPDIKARAKQVYDTLKELYPLYANFSHLSGWLEYEAQHRADLKREAERERKRRAEMRKEAGWLEQILIDVFRKTSGCHYIYSDNGKEITKAPKFERSVTTADAHYFYVAVSRRVLFGWRWLLPYGVTIKRLTDEDVLENMRAATKRQVDIVWSETNQLMFRVSRLDSPDALPKSVMWRDAMKFYPDGKRDKLPYTIGVSENRKFQWFDLASDPHILVAGKSQSGKSNLVNGIIATLASTHSPDELRIILIDQKGGIEFTHWSELPHLLWDVVKTVDEVEPVLTRIVSVMRQRMATLEKAKAKDIATYNKRVDQDQRMARVLVVIDEMNTFVGLGKLTEDIQNLIMLLVSQGRAVGIHVMTATQHPEVRVIPGRIKTNMSMRLSGAMPTISASQIVLDNPEAARIPNLPGRFVAVLGLKTLIVQCPQILDSDIAGVVSSCQKEYPEVAENLRDVKAPPKVIVWDEPRTLNAAIDWLEGHLSGQKLHKLLGDESPGERHLSRMCKRIIDQAQEEGIITHDDGTKWIVEKIKRGYYLKPQPDQPDKKDVPENDDSVSD